MFNLKFVFIVVSISAVTVPTCGICPTGFVTKEFIEASYAVTTESISMKSCSITFIEDNTFEKYSKVTSLDISDNEIFVFTENTFKGLYSLKHLILSGNPLIALHSGIFKHLPELTELDFKLCSLITIEEGAFQGLQSLTMLKMEPGWIIPENLIYTPFTGSIFKNTFQGLSSLSLLNLKGTNILSVENGAFEHLVNLEIIDMGNALPLTLNRVGNGTLQGLLSLRYLKTLDLSNNHISSFDNDAFRHLENLTSLHLETNYVSDIRSNTFKGLHSLRSLHLNHNKIVIIETDSFSDMHSLNDLRLHDNRIATITDGMFRGLNNLKFISLCNNNIQTLSQESVWLLGNKTLDLTGNPFQCYCDMVWLKEWYDRDSSISVLITVTCVTPFSGPLISRDLTSHSCLSRPSTIQQPLTTSIEETPIPTSTEASSSNSGDNDILYIILVLLFVVVIFLLVVFSVIGIHLYRRTKRSERNEDREIPVANLHEQDVTNNANYSNLVTSSYLLPPNVSQHNPVDQDSVRYHYPRFSNVATMSEVSSQDYENPGSVATYISLEQ